MNDDAAGLPADARIFDLEHFLLVCGPDPEFQREIIGDFRDQAGVLLARLEAAVAAGEAGTIRSVAHAFKGSSRSLGGATLGEICARLESLGASGQIATVPRELEQARDACDRLLDELQRHLDRPPG